MKFDLSCARCGRVYHTCDEHIEKKIQCQNPACHGQEIYIARAGSFTARKTAVVGYSRPSLTKAGRLKKLGYLRKHRWLAICIVMLAVFPVAFLVHNLLSQDGVPKGLRTPEHIGGVGSTYASSGANTAAQSTPDIFDQISKGVLNTAPQATPLYRPPKYQPRTGAIVQGLRPTYGHGILTIANGASSDSVIAIVHNAGGVLLCSLYIRAGDTLDLDQMPPGNYKLLFSSGIDWDFSAKEFRQDASYTEFGDTLEFSETRTENGITRDKQRITLFTVPNGNVTPRSVDKSAFLAALSSS